MASPPTPVPLDTDPDGKPGVPDHLLQNARRAIEMARAEAERCMRMRLGRHPSNRTD